MSSLETNPLTAFHWTPQPQAEQFVLGIVNDFLSRNHFAAQLAVRMKEETGTRFPDWIGYIRLPPQDPLVRQLDEVGYQRAIGVKTVAYNHPAGMFPTIIIEEGDEREIALKVESATDFLTANHLNCTIYNPTGADVRRAVVAVEAGTALAVVERHGIQWANVLHHDEHGSTYKSKHVERLQTRQRGFAADAEGFLHLNALLDEVISDLGTDLTCDIFFAAERDYWMSRNRAAQIQKARQDKLGLGWANHDHHTYRSSRDCFSALVAIHEKLGLVCRERFYAGKDAGWGAQVMEQPVTGIITFNDVDLSPEELRGDFAHEPLAKRASLGTVGLWCALHGEAILQAGMHHLEAQFDFESLRQQLESEAGVRTMKPFTNFAYLRQAFTEGERWKVSEDRIVRALKSGYITVLQAQQFREQGAIGSHLENLERKEGFKGFNQTGVSEIISATDPRKQLRP